MERQRETAYRDGYIDGTVAVLLRFVLARVDISTCNRVKAHLVKKLRPWARQEPHKSELPPGFDEALPDA